MKPTSNETRFTIILDELLKETMNREVLPFLTAIGSAGYVTVRRRNAGTGKSRLYYEAYRPQAPRGAIVISHGYSESVEKYKEVIYYFTQAGYQVYLADHRGHGRSVRDTDHPCMVHVAHFKDYVRDLHTFIAKVVEPSVNGQLPLYLYAHSMGGAIGALYLEAWPDTFQKAVLSAPMLSLSMGALPIPCARALGRIRIRLNRGATYPPGQHPFTPGDAFETSCSSCRQRYDYYREKKEANPLFQTCGSSYGWAYEALNACHHVTQKKNCRRITVPVLVFQSTNDTTVTSSGIERFVANTPSAALVKVDQSKHEIYNSTASVLKEYYQRIFDFLQPE